MVIFLVSAFDRSDWMGCLLESDCSFFSLQAFGGLVSDDLTIGQSEWAVVYDVVVILEGHLLYVNVLWQSLELIFCWPLECAFWRLFGLSPEAYFAKLVLDYIRGLEFKYDLFKPLLAFLNDFLDLVLLRLCTILRLSKLIIPVLLVFFNLLVQDVLVEFEAWNVWFFVSIQEW